MDYSGWNVLDQLIRLKIGLYVAQRVFSPRAKCIKLWKEDVASLGRCTRLFVGARVRWRSFWTQRVGSLSAETTITARRPRWDGTDMNIWIWSRLLLGSSWVADVSPLQSTLQKLDVTLGWDSGQRYGTLTTLSTSHILIEYGNFLSVGAASSKANFSYIVCGKTNLKAVGDASSIGSWHTVDVLPKDSVFMRINIPRLRRRDGTTGW